VAARRVLVETSILLHHFREKGKGKTVFEQAAEIHRRRYISAITVFEIEFGAIRAGRTSDLQDILKLVEILPFGRAEAEEAARVHADLVSRNQIIGIRDVFIAGTCLAHRLPILTENEEHFRRVRGLTLAKVQLD